MSRERRTHERLAAQLDGVIAICQRFPVVSEEARLVAGAHVEPGAHPTALDQASQHILQTL